MFYVNIYNTLTNGARVSNFHTLGWQQLLTKVLPGGLRESYMNKALTIYVLDLTWYIFREYIRPCDFHTLGS